MKSIRHLLCGAMIFSGPCFAGAPQIGVMLGSSNMVSGAPSSSEKLCVINALEELSGVDFVIYENHRSRRGSVDAAERMVADGIDFALLPLVSDEAIAAVPILGEANIPYLTSATSETVVKSPEQGLSIFPPNKYQAEFLANLYVDDYSARPLAVFIDESSAYSKQLSAQFITQVHILNPSIDVEVKSIVGDSFLEFSGLSGYVVFAALFNPKIALLYRQLSQESDVVLLGGDSVGVRKEFLNIVGENSERSEAELIFLKNWDGVPRGRNIEEFWSIFYRGCTKQRMPTFINAYVYDMGGLAIDWVLSDTQEGPLSFIRDSRRESILDGEAFTFAADGYRARKYFLFHYIGGSNAVPLP